MPGVVVGLVRGASFWRVWSVDSWMRRDRWRESCCFRRRSIGGWAGGLTAWAGVGGVVGVVGVVGVAGFASVADVAGAGVAGVAGVAGIAGVAVVADVAGATGVADVVGVSVTSSPCFRICFRSWSASCQVLVL